MFWKYHSQHCFSMTVLKNHVILAVVFWCSMYVQLFCFIGYHVHFTETVNSCLSELLCVLQHSFEPNSRSSSDPSYQVVTTRMSDIRQYSQRKHTLTTSLPPAPQVALKAVSSLKWVSTVQPSSWLRFLISQLRTASYVLTECVELCLGFIYTAADSPLDFQQQLSVRHLALSEEEACYLSGTQEAVTQHHVTVHVFSKELYWPRSVLRRHACRLEHELYKIKQSGKDHISALTGVLIKHFISPLNITKEKQRKKMTKQQGYNNSKFWLVSNWIRWFTSLMLKWNSRQNAT